MVVVDRFLRVAVLAILSIPAVVSAVRLREDVVHRRAMTEIEAGCIDSAFTDRVARRSPEFAKRLSHCGPN